MSFSTLTPVVPTYDHKAGKVIIFNGDNFPDWERTCEAALIMAEGWDLLPVMKTLHVLTQLMGGNEEEKHSKSFLIWLEALDKKRCVR
jgi:hypothetical protein